jgi:hypothetical protein
MATERVTITVDGEDRDVSYRRAKQLARIDVGFCAFCYRPKVNATYCQKHREMVKASIRKRYKRKKK